MMGGDQGEDFVFRSSESDDDDAGWKFLQRQSHRHRLKKIGFCRSPTSNSNSSTSSSTNTTDSLDNCTATSQITLIPETPKHLLASKKRTVSEAPNSKNVLHSKRNCSHPHLPMGNGFRHERVGNNTSSGDPNPDSSKSSEMSWQNRQSDRTNQSSSFNQPSGSSQESSSRQPRYHNQPLRRNLIISSDSDDDNDWTERTSDKTTFQSHSNSPEHAISQQRSKRLANNPPRKSKTGYLSRPNRDPGNNNNSTAQPSASQTVKDTGTSNGVAHHNHRLKRNTAAASNVSGASARSSNEDDSRNNQPQSQTTPKNRHLHRLRMHQNRSPAAGVSSYTGSSESETFPSNLPFRRDDPGRRAFSRSGHPLHGRRSQGSPHHHHRSPLLRGQESSFQSLVRRNPDLFESESTDEGGELFAGGTNSLTRNSFRQSSPRHRNSFQYQTFGSTTLSGTERGNLEEADDPSVVFVPENRVSPMSRSRRRDQGRFTGGSGGRRRRSSRPSHLLSGERSLLSSSPDPVAQVNQMEEDERLARLLQAEFDAELTHHRHSENGGHIYHSESDVDVLVDEEETLSSLSSSSSNAEDTSFSGRHRQNRLFYRQQNSLGEAGPSDPPARGRRRGVRAPTSTPTVAPPRHWHGSPVRGRRGRTRSSPNADPFMLQFGRWLGWALIRNLDTEEDDYEVLWNLAESMGEAVPRGLQRHEINRLPTHKYQPAASTSDSTSGAGGSSSNNNNISKPSSTTATVAATTTTTTFTEATKECRVCLCDYEVNELLRVLPCFHEFHAVCIDKWLKNNNTCPVCRAEIALDS